MDKITHKVRCEQWTSIIKECLASGMPKTTSAYAKVIAEELPDAMQVADRFHQNLLEAIKKVLNHELPATIKIPHNDEPEESRETDKKLHRMWITPQIIPKNVIR